jgi:putative addiction module CopG family antidote
MARPVTPADLPPDLAHFAEALVAAGRFASVEDVLRAGKEALEHEQQRQERKLQKLRAAIAEGDASPDAEPGVFDRIRAKYGLPATR